MSTSRTFTLPYTLTVEDEPIYDPGDKYGDPIGVIIKVKFGDYEVAKYELRADHWPGEFFFEDSRDKSHMIHYDNPEEFLAHKLRKIFMLVEEEG